MAEFACKNATARNQQQDVVDTSSDKQFIVPYEFLPDTTSHRYNVDIFCCVVVRGLVL